MAKKLTVKHERDLRFLKGRICILYGCARVPNSTIRELAKKDIEQTTFDEPVKKAALEWVDKQWP